MRTLISTLLLCVSLTLSAYDNPRRPEIPAFSAGMRGGRITGSGYTIGSQSAPVKPMYVMRSVHVRRSASICFPISKGVPFCSSAVFCRMENHFLNTYNVKFSIHTGGFRE